MALAPGAKLGPYEIVAALGAGGMGEVYRARDTKLKRDVALKVLPETFAEDPERMARFQREAEVLASLNHTNIAQIYGVEDRALVMELVEGESPKGPLPFDEAWKIAAQIAAGLDYAHERGIVHRDLKPANIKITPDGVAKLLDFGLAKAFTGPTAASGNLDNSPTLTLGATQVGVILGTAAYMAPEQARGKAVDKRADIWSFGVVLYELLTGERLFGGEDISETLAHVLTRSPDWQKCPRQARRLLQGCLEKDPKNRLRDIGDVQRLLEGENAPIAAAATPAAPQEQTGWWTWAVMGMLAAALAGVAWLHFREAMPVEHVLRYTVAPPEGASVHSFAVSPDGKLVVLAAAVNGKRQLWLRPMDALQWQPLPSTNDARYPFWSPDSRNLAFFAENKLRRIAASGGPSQPICDAGEGRGGSWSREDVIVFSPSGSLEGSIQRVAAAGGVPVALTKTPSRYLFPTFLPDGRHFLFLMREPTGQKDGIYLGSLDGAGDRRVLADISGPTFVFPALGERLGAVLFLREANLMAQPFDTRTLQFAGDVYPVAEAMSLANGNNYAPVSVSDNGFLLYWAGGSGGIGGQQNQMVWYDRTGKAEPVGGVANIVMPAISPDGKTIAFSRGTAAGGGNRDIWLRDLERGNERRLTTDSSANTTPVWSPTGDRIVFRSARSGTGDLYIRAANGSGQDERLLVTSGGKGPDQWSPAGFFVYHEVDPKNKQDIWVLPMDEKAGERKPKVFLHSAFNELDGQLSPDAKWMAYTSDVSGAREIYVQPFPAADNEIRISIAGGEQPRWRGDGKELYYIGADGKMTAVPITITAGAKPVFKAGTPVPLFDAHSSEVNNQYFNYDVTPDGKRFIVATPGGTSAGYSGAVAPPLTVQLNWRPKGK